MGGGGLFPSSKEGEAQKSPGEVDFLRFACSLGIPQRDPLNLIRDRKGTPKNFGDRDFVELSGELSGAICRKTLVLMGHDR